MPLREDCPKPPVMVKEAPVQEVVLTGKDIDVTQLPILTYHEKDAGRYITAGFGIMRDPDSGVRNAGIYRLMIHSKDTFGIQLIRDCSRPLHLANLRETKSTYADGGGHRPPPRFLYRLSFFHFFRDR